MAFPTQARLREYYNYDPETGIFKHKLRPKEEFKTELAYTRHVNRVGKPAGTINAGGYVKLHLDGKVLSAHRLAWLHETGDWPLYPEYEIDHINGITTDNRIHNLRRVTKSENQRNARMRKNNTSGVHGVNWCEPKKQWISRIWNGPRHVFLGGFKTLEEAAAARLAGERLLGYTRTSEKAAP